MLRGPPDAIPVGDTYGGAAEFGLPAGLPRVVSRETERAVVDVRAVWRAGA